MFEIGPILRSSRRRMSIFAVVVLQLAATFMIYASLRVIGSWFRGIGHTEPGYDRSELVGVSVRGPRAWAVPAAADLARLAALPGVAAAARLSPPLRAEEGTPTLLRDLARGGREVRGWTVYATPSVADVLGLRFVEGGVESAPTTGDRVIVTRRLRDAIFAPGEPAVGRWIAADDAPAAIVVGVVEDIMLREPFFQDPTSIAFRLAPPPARGEEEVVLRVHPGAHPEAVAALRATVGPSSPARAVSITDYAATPPRIQTVADGLVNLFLSVALTIAAIALVGALAVSSFVVTERRAQIGIRRALGATRWDVFRYFLVEGSISAALGTGLGIVLTLALLFAMRRVFPDLPIDWRHLVAAAGLLWANATVAAALPARGAARISPALAGRGR
jgi:putative ABC transport system permease protein